MNRDLEIALLEELQGLKSAKRFFLDEEVRRSPVERYASETRFEAEMASVFRAAPMVAAHASEMPEPGSFLTRTLAGRPVLLTRDKQGEAHAFLNVCRHRGARLVGQEQGCKHAFSCPYHAWTWDSSGRLRGAPHQAEGFPDLDREAYGLRRLPAVERLGLIWVVADPDADPDFDAHIDPLAEDFAWMGMEEMAIAASEPGEGAANWKLLVEGGIEAYHFKVTHRETIGPHFVDNLSSYEMLGPHMRSVLPRETLPALAETPREDWSIRDHANVLYTLFATDQFLLMQDHVAWVSLQPLSAGRTQTRITTLAPKAELTPEKEAHWARNHAITLMTLAEDFEVNISVQAGLESGANDALTFGRFEGALHRFNAQIEARLGGLT